MIGTLVFGYVPMGRVLDEEPPGGWDNQCKNDSGWTKQSSNSSPWGNKAASNGAWQKQPINAVNTNKCG